MFDSLKKKLKNFKEDIDDIEQKEDLEEKEDTEKQESVKEESEIESSSDIKKEEKETTGVREKVRKPFSIDSENLEDPLEELKFSLISSDVSVEAAEEILDGVENRLVGERRGWRSSVGNIAQEALKDSILDLLSVDGIDFDEYIENSDKPIVIIFAGVNGVGKTTTIAKIAKRLEEKEFSSVLANGDTFRAGANEQLEQHASNLDKKIIKHEKGGDPAAVLYDAVEHAKAKNIDVVLGDTAGRLHTSNDLMDELSKIERVVEPDLTLFVDEGIAGQDAIKRAKQFNDSIGIDGIILTKVDADAKGGAAVSIVYSIGKPILFLGTGEDYSDLERFSPKKFVEELFN